MVTLNKVNSTENVDGNGAKVLANAMRKCYTIRSTDIRLIGY